MNKKDCRRNYWNGHNAKHFKRVYFRREFDWIRGVYYRRGNIIWIN